MIAPIEAARHAAALKVGLQLSYRTAQELLRVRGFEISHETIRAWVAAHGDAALPLLRAGAAWRADCRMVTLRREPRYLWLAVSETGEVGEVFLQSRRNESLALGRLRAGIAQQRELAARLPADNLT